MLQNLVVCDFCGKQSKVEFSSARYDYLPDGWITLQINFLEFYYNTLATHVHSCGDCARERFNIDTTQAISTEDRVTLEETLRQFIRSEIASTLIQREQKSRGSSATVDLTQRFER